MAKRKGGKHDHSSQSKKGRKGSGKKMPMHKEQSDLKNMS